jgi:uncharacterized protein YndB with AHSA1/START domain
MASDPDAGASLPPMVLRRVFRAPPAQVFAAFTRPEILKQWWGHSRYTVPRADIDLRVGGAYHIVMQRPDGETLEMGGVYREVTPITRLSFTWNWLKGGPMKGETLVSFDFAPHPDGTEVVLTHDGFVDAQVLARHDEGWIATLDSLDRYLQGNRAQEGAQQ